MKISKKALGLLVGFLILFLLLWHLDFKEIAQKLSHMNPALFAAAIFWIAMGQLAGYAKWLVMKQKTHPDVQMPMAKIYSSVFVTGMVTPARAGDLLASFAWPAYQGTILAWSILNRIFEGGMTIVLALVVLGFFFSRTLEGLHWSGLLVFTAIAVCGITLVFSRKFGSFVFDIAKKLLRKWERFGWTRRILNFENHIEAQMKIFYDTLDEMKKAHALTQLLFLTLLARFCTIFSNYILLHSLGAYLRWQDLLGILAVTWVSGFFAPTPNGIGIGDLPPSLLLAHLGYQAFAGSFVVMNRLLEAVITAVWFLIGFNSKTLFKPAVKKNEI